MKEMLTFVVELPEDSSTVYFRAKISRFKNSSHLNITIKTDIVNNARVRTN